MGNVSGLKCVNCNSIWLECETETTCPNCGLEGILDVIYEPIQLSSAQSLQEKLYKDTNYTIWRYSFILPIAPKAVLPTVPVGWSPSFRSERLEKDLNLPTLWIKDDGRNPTASLKDRASAVAVVRAMSANKQVVACSSTGNAATSLAGLAANTGLQSFIFIPADAPPAKQVQLKVFGATVFLVEGSYADAFNLSTSAIDAFGWYNRNCAINPYLVEGKKTVAWEFAEQTNWNPPDIIFVPIGDGCTISGVYKGFFECKKFGLISKIPQIIGVQAENAAPIYKAWKENKQMKPQEANTIADSISVGHPKNYRKALNAISASDGEIITISDNEIVAAQTYLAATTGVFGEPAGVAGFAGLLSLQKQNKLSANYSYGIIVTGNGLKDINSVRNIKGSITSLPINPEKAFPIIESVVSMNNNIQKT